MTPKKKSQKEHLQKRWSPLPAFHIKQIESGHEISYTDGLPVLTDRTFRKQTNKQNPRVPSTLALPILMHFCPRLNTSYCSNLEKILLGYHLVLLRRKMQCNVVPATQKS